MRRGRIFIYLALILIVGVGAAALYLSRGAIGRPEVTPTPAPRLVDIVIAGQSISPNTQITAEMLSTMKIPEDQFVTVLFKDPAQVVGQYAKYSIEPGVPITSSLLSPVPVVGPEGRGEWIYRIPGGMTAISVPVTRLSAVAYALRDGDHVDVIVSFLLVDVDANYQSLLPNTTSAVISANTRTLLIGGGTQEEPSGSLESKELLLNLTAQSVSGLSLSPQGRVEFDPNLQTPFYVVPSEAQRPRLVTQMAMQDVMVLKVGTFPLPGEGERPAQPQVVAEGTPTPGVQQTPQEETPTAIQRPDIITLVVTPQEAVALTYMMYSNAQITFTLRGAGDTSRVETEAVTLQYLLSRYNIPVPAKLPYSMQPRIDQLVPPFMPNDVIIVTPEE